ncbi:unnamed protein product [Closterium sp. NIES-53]
MAHQCRESLLQFSRLWGGEHGENLCEAMGKELKALEGRNTWNIVPIGLARNKAILTGKWVFRVKTKADGTIDKFKARWVVRGFDQEYGRDFTETFASVSRHTSLRILLAIAAMKRKKLRQIDVANAFLYAPVDGEIFIKQPHGSDTDPNQVCQLVKSLYGIKQPPRLWQQYLHTRLIRIGFQQLPHDQGMYRLTKEAEYILLIVYVDDLLYIGSTDGITNWFEGELQQDLSLTVSSTVTQYLGLNILDGENAIYLSAAKYADTIAKRFGLTPASIFMPYRYITGNHEEKSNLLGPAGLRDYQRKLGCLLFVAVTCRPDLSYSASQLATHLKWPEAEHMAELDRALHYLVSTPTIGLTYHKTETTTPKIIGYVDADHAGDSNNRRSRTGYIYRVEPIGPISWQSSKQELIALSSAEAEYIALCSATKEGLYLHKLLEEAKLAQLPSFSLFCDNQSAICIAKKSGFANRTKYIALRYFFVKDEIEKGRLELSYCPTSEMAADYLTKKLGKQKFEGKYLLVKAALDRDAKASKLSSRTLRCVFLGFPTDAPPWQFYHPRSRRVFSSQDVTFDESVCYYRLHPHASHPVPLAPLFLVSVPLPVEPLPPQGPSPSGVCQVDPPPLVEPLEISSDSSGPAEGGDPAADDTAATRRSPCLETRPGGAETEDEGSGGAATGGAGSWGAVTGGADSGGPARPSGGRAVGDPAGDPGAGQPPQLDLLETLSPQAIHAWIVRRGNPDGGGYGPAGAGATSPRGTAGAGGTGGTAGGAGGAASAGGTRGAAGAGGAGATSPRGATGAGGAGPTNLGGTTGAGGAGGAAGAGGAGAGGNRGAGAAGPGGSRTGGAGAARAGGAVRAGGATGAAGSGGTRGATGAAGSGGARGTTGARGAGVGGTGGTGGAGAAGAGGAAGVGGAGGATGATALEVLEVLLVLEVLGLPELVVLLEVLVLEVLELLVLEELELLVLPRADRFSTRSRSRPCRRLTRSFARFFPHLLPGSPLPAPAPHTEKTESLTERREPETRASTPFRARRRVVLPEPPASSLPHVSDPESDLARAASPTVTPLLGTDITDPDLESTAAFSLITELVDFAARSRLDNVASLVTESKSVCPPSVGGEPALSNDVLEDRQFELECLVAALPRFASMLLCPEGDPDALDIPTPRSYAEAIAGDYSSQWQTAMDAEMASWKSTGTYVDEVPTLGANIVDGMWIFRVKRPPGSPLAFKARYVARGFSQRQGVDFFQTFSPTSKMTTLWVLLHVAAQRDYKLHSLDFSTAFLQGSLHEKIWLHRPPGFTGTTLAALGFAPSSADPSLFLRTDTSLPPFYVLVYVLQRFSFHFSSPQPTPLSTDHSLSALPSEESVQPSGPYPELVGCLMYLMTWTRPDLAYSLSLLARYAALGRHRKLTYLLADLGEQPRSPPVLYVDNKAMLALCHEQRLEHRMKHIALRYFLARELQQRCQLRLSYVASQANTADVFTKALGSEDFPVVGSNWDFN